MSKPDKVCGVCGRGYTNYSNHALENEHLAALAERRAAGKAFRTAPMKDGIRYDSRGEPIR